MIRKLVFTVLTLATLLTVSSAYLLLSGGPIFNVSAVESTGNMGIYWDAICSNRVESISWGVLLPNQIAKAVVYVRNEANVSAILILNTANWNPANASTYLKFSWNAQNISLDPGDVVKVSLYLSVSPDTKGISTFSFDIVFEGRDSFSADVNQDGVVDLLDLVVIAVSYDSTPASPNWNPDADTNYDGVVDIMDITYIAIALEQAS